MTFKKPEVSKYDVINRNSPLTVALHLAGPNRITKSYFKFDPKKHSIELMFTLLIKTHNKQKASLSSSFCHNLQISHTSLLTFSEKLL